MAALGFQPHIIERVLNHVSGAQGGLVGVYQRHEYRAERKRAIVAWSDSLNSFPFRLRARGRTAIGSGGAFKALAFAILESANYPNQAEKRHSG
jgi:exopolyphosphatase/pppGpp-phosphohydrolase